MDGGKLGISIIAVVLAAVIGISYHGEAVTNSYNEGYNKGYSEAEVKAEELSQIWYNDGYDDGYDSGYDKGYDQGKKDGYNSGYSKGKNDGYNSGYNAAFSALPKTTTSSYSVKQPSTSISKSTTVYITKTGSKYHRSGCSYLKSKIPISLSNAIAQGYTACSRCF